MLTVAPVLPVDRRTPPCVRQDNSFEKWPKTKHVVYPDGTLSANILCMYHSNCPTCIYMYIGYNVAYIHVYVYKLSICYMYIHMYMVTK